MITEGISKALADLRAAGCDADADRIESALTKAEAVEPLGWANPERPTLIVPKSLALENYIPVYAHAPLSGPLEETTYPARQPRTHPMQIRSSSNVKTTTTHVIELSLAEATNATDTHGSLAGAAISGHFPGVSAVGSDVIAIDARTDSVIVVVVTERTTIPDDTESNS